MARIGTFTFRVNKQERRVLANLAAHLQRSQSDAIRLIIREAAQQLATPPAWPAQERRGESSAQPSEGSR